MTREDVDLMAEHYGVDADDLEMRFCDSSEVEQAADTFVSESWYQMEELARELVVGRGLDSGAPAFEPFDFDTAWSAHHTVTVPTDEPSQGAPSAGRLR
jgi:hypothetical protein